MQREGEKGDREMSSRGKMRTKMTKRRERKMRKRMGRVSLLDILVSEATRRKTQINLSTFFFISSLCFL